MLEVLHEKRVEQNMVIGKWGYASIWEKEPADYAVFKYFGPDGDCLGETWASFPVSDINLSAVPLITFQIYVSFIF